MVPCILGTKSREEPGLQRLTKPLRWPDFLPHPTLLLPSCAPPVPPQAFPLAALWREGPSPGLHFIQASPVSLRWLFWTLCGHQALPSALPVPAHVYPLWGITMHLFVHGVPCSPGLCCCCASQAVPRQLGTRCRLTVVLYDSWPRPFPPAILVRAQLCESAELWVRPVTPAGALPAMSWAGCQELWGCLGTHSPSGSAERRWASWVEGLGRPSHPAPSLKRPRGMFMGI